MPLNKSITNFSELGVFATDSETFAIVALLSCVKRLCIYKKWNDGV